MARAGGRSPHTLEWTDATGAQLQLLGTRSPQTEKDANADKRAAGAAETTTPPPTREGAVIHDAVGRQMGSGTCTHMTDNSYAGDRRAQHMKNHE